MSTDCVIRLIVGLGNPGDKYLGTRHNSGNEFVRKLACQLKSSELKKNVKLFSNASRLSNSNGDLHLIIPDTFMNESGRSVAAYSSFFKINPREILIAHDDLDIPAGAAKFKIGGGHGGHNGLRDIIWSLGKNDDFYRLRIGIGHPGTADKVTSYVLSRPSEKDRESIDLAINEAMSLVPLLLEGDLALAMTKLNGKVFSQTSSTETS